MAEIRIASVMSRDEKLLIYTDAARWYDAIYAHKDYAAEASNLHAFIAGHMQRPARTLLDVACGTGRHLAELQSWFEVEGADLNEALLGIAQARLPDVRLHRADMRSLDLARSFDVVTCLFSAIGYMTTLADLQAAIAAMARHVAPGGLMIVEPWWPPDNWIVDGKPRSVFIDQPDLKIARISLSGREQDVAVMEMQYLIGSADGIIHFREEHRMALFTAGEQIAAIQAAGLEAIHDPDGLNGRGLFIGRAQG
jgi:SAM-dependent methyltransferase